MVLGEFHSYLNVYCRYLQIWKCRPAKKIKKFGKYGHMKWSHGFRSRVEITISGSSLLTIGIEVG